jgi:CheY-like chemotaxis protein
VYEQLLADKTILVLEDQILIAMEVEHSLLQMGARSVVVACSVAEALEALEHAVPDVAVLDINLGPSTTSFPVAEALLRHGAPWVFATGYGDEIKLPPQLKSAAMVRKPYTTDMLGKALQHTFPVAKSI